MTTQTIWKSPVCKISNTKAMRWHGARYATCMRGAEDHLEHWWNLQTDITQTCQYHRRAHICLKIRGVEKNQKHNSKSINRCLRRILSIYWQRGSLAENGLNTCRRANHVKTKGMKQPHTLKADLQHHLTDLEMEPTGHKKERRSQKHLAETLML